MAEMQILQALLSALLSTVLRNRMKPTLKICNLLFVNSIRLVNGALSRSKQFSIKYQEKYKNWSL